MLKLARCDRWGRVEGGKEGKSGGRKGRGERKGEEDRVRRADVGISGSSQGVYGWIPLCRGTT